MIWPRFGRGHRFTYLGKYDNISHEIKPRDFLAESRPPGIREISVGCPGYPAQSADDAKAVAADALACKEPKQKPWGQTVAYVRDNDGFLVKSALLSLNGISDGFASKHG